MKNHILLQIYAYSFLRQINKRLCLIPNKHVLFSVNAFASTKSPHRHYIIFYIKNQGGRIGSFLVWWRCGDLPYSDCYHRSIACSRRGSHGDAVLRFFKIAINPRIDDIEKQVEQEVQLVSRLVEMRGFEPRFVLLHPTPSTCLFGD